MTNPLFVIDGEDEDTLFLKNTTTLQTVPIDKRKDPGAANFAKSTYPRISDKHTTLTENFSNFYKEQPPVAQPPVAQPLAPKQPLIPPAAPPQPGATVSLNPPPMPAPTPPKSGVIPSIENAWAGLSGVQSKVRGDQQRVEQAADRAAEAQTEAVFAAQNAGKLQAEQEAAYYKEAKKQKEAEALQTQELEKQRQDKLNSELGKYKQMQSELANKKIQPWSSKPAGQQITTALAAMAFGFGAGAAGQGPGASISYLQNTIDRDLALQQEQINKKKDGLAIQGNILSLTRQQFSDDRVAEAAAKALKWDALELDLKQKLSLTKNQQILANGQKLLGDIEAQKASNLQTITQSTNQQLLSAEAQKADLAAKAAQINAEKAGKGQMDIRVPGLLITGEATPTKEDVAKVKAAKGEYDAAVNTLDELIQLRKKYGPEYFGGNVQSRMEALTALLKQKMNVLQGQGAMSEGDKEIIEKGIGDPTALGWKEARLEAARSYILDRARSFYRPYGYLDPSDTAISGAR